MFLNHGLTEVGRPTGEVSWLAHEENPSPSAGQEEGCGRWHNWPDFFFLLFFPIESVPYLEEQAETAFWLEEADCDWCHKVYRTSREKRLL